MECPSCAFQNTPGTLSCVRCRGLLDFSAVSVVPPRARRGAVRRGARRAADQVGFSLRDAFHRSPVAALTRLPDGVSVPALLASFVPGMGQVVLGSRLLGIGILIAWCLLMVLTLLNFGSNAAFLSFTMAVGLHCGAVSALFTRSLRHETVFYRASCGFMVYVVLVVTIYGPVYWGSGEIVTVIPAQHLRAGNQIQEGDLVVATGQWLKPTLRRGDLVVYRIHASRSGVVQVAEGMLLDRILGEPGDTVVINGSSLTVNGVMQPQGAGPIGAGVAPGIAVTLMAGADEYIILPSTLVRRGHGDVGAALGDVMHNLSRVAKGDVLGRVFWRVGDGLDFGPIRSHTQ